MRINEKGLLTDDRGNVKMCPFQPALPFQQKLTVGKGVSLALQIPCTEHCVLFTIAKKNCEDEASTEGVVQLHCGNVQFPLKK